MIGQTQQATNSLYGANQQAPKEAPGFLAEVGGAFASGLKAGAWVGGVVLAVGIPLAIVSHLKASD